MRWMIPALLGLALTIPAGAAAQAPANGAPAKGGQATAVHACSLLTSDDIARVTGQKNHFNLPPEHSEQANGVTGCNHVGLDLSLTPRMTPQLFALNRQEQASSGYRIQSITGIGDEAYYYDRPGSRSSNIGVVFRVGQHRLALGDRVSSDSVAYMRPRLEALAKLAAAKMAATKPR